MVAIADTEVKKAITDVVIAFVYELVSLNSFCYCLHF
jgi:hypothetical protein